MATYWLLLGPIGPSPAKAVSFLCACGVAYLLNKFWTFKTEKHSWTEISKFLGLYTSTFLTNIAVNKLVIVAIPEVSPALNPYTFQLGWLMATGVSTIINYIGQKFWVFRNNPAP